MRTDHFLAVLIQMLPMYLVFCLVGNTPVHHCSDADAAGSMKPVKPKAATILIHTAFMFLFPIALSPTLIPLGIEFLLSWTGSRFRLASGVPGTGDHRSAIVDLVLPARFSAVQGELLERREQQNS